MMPLSMPVLTRIIVIIGITVGQPDVVPASIRVSPAIPRGAGIAVTQGSILFFLGFDRFGKPVAMPRKRGGGIGQLLAGMGQIGFGLPNVRVIFDFQGDFRTQRLKPMRRFQPELPRLGVTVINGVPCKIVDLPIDLRPSIVEIGIHRNPGAVVLLRRRQFIFDCIAVGEQLLITRFVSGDVTRYASGVPFVLRVTFIHLMRGREQIGTLLKHCGHFPPHSGEIGSGFFVMLPGPVQCVCSVATSLAVNGAGSTSARTGACGRMNRMAVRGTNAKRKWISLIQPPITPTNVIL